MKTFDEACEFVTKCGGRDPMELYRIQSEFAEEVNSSALLEAVSQTCYCAAGALLDTFDKPIVFHNGFMNGVRLGVTVGVYMERAELEEPAVEGSYEQCAEEILDAVEEAFHIRSVNNKFRPKTKKALTDILRHYTVERR